MSILRRLRISLLAVFSGICLGVSLAPSQAQEVTTAHGDSRTRILIDGELFCEFIHGDSSPDGEIPRPFIYPIIGPTGAAMTRGYPMDDSIEGESHDHPHHRSLWFAHGDVNGVDFWAQGDDKGRIADDIGGDAIVLITGDNRFLFFGTNWVSPDDTVLLQSLDSYSFLVLDDGSRVIDSAVELYPAPGIEEVVFGDTKEGTMAIRTHPALRLVGDHATGHAINSAGDTDRELWGKRAAWVAYWGEIDGETCGVAIFDHPENPRHPTWWHARDYGLIAANPFGIHDFEDEPEGTGDYTLVQGETLSLRYRFVFFAGTAEDADIAGKYDRWVESMNPETQDDQE